MQYLRFITKGLQPYNPVELAKKTEEIVTREGPEGLERKYTGFQSRPVYRGISTGYAAGCCLRCIYCWSDWSRDFPDLLGKFYSPSKVAENLIQAAKEGIPEPYWRKLIPTITKLRLSGCEPTLGQDHLISLLEILQNTGYMFYLETNGILIGNNKDYAKKLSKFADFIYVRVSLKAGTPEGFTLRTGAIGKYYELPFKALKYLLDVGIDARAAAMTDSKVMPNDERKILISKLGEIDPRYYKGELEEEVIDSYDTTVQRIKAFFDPKYEKELKKKIITQYS